MDIANQQKDGEKKEERKKIRGLFVRYVACAGRIYITLLQ